MFSQKNMLEYLHIFLSYHFRSFLSPLEHFSIANRKHIPWSPTAELRWIQFWSLCLIFSFFHSDLFIIEAPVIVSKAPGNCICLKQVPGPGRIGYRPTPSPELLVSRATISVSETIQTTHLNNWCIVLNAAAWTCLNIDYTP